MRGERGEIGSIFRQILRDIKVELSDEFDRNFERQAFFSDKWKRSRRAERRGGATLIDTGRLRRSITSRSDATSITFYTTEPYAAIHNEGGEIKVTAKMKRFFWAKYYESSGAFGRRKDGALRRDKRNARLTDESSMWKCLALMRVGSRIKIPRRRFLGASPEVERAVRDIIEENLSDFLGNRLAVKIQEDIDTK